LLKAAKRIDASQSLVKQLQTEMAPWTKDTDDDLEDGLIRTSIAAEGVETSNASQNSNAHGTWWFCIGLFFASGIIFFMGVLHSLVHGSNADNWLEGNVTWCATVLMLVSYAWLVSNTPCRTDNDHNQVDGIIIASAERNEAHRAAQGGGTNNEWKNSQTRGLWWVWVCLYAVSGFVALNCRLYSNVNGALPTAVIWLQGVATVLLGVSCFWLNYMITMDYITMSADKNEVRNLRSPNELQGAPTPL
jgi:hypothetical protein